MTKNKHNSSPSHEKDGKLSASTSPVRQHHKTPSSPKHSSSPKKTSPKHSTTTTSSSSSSSSLKPTKTQTELLFADLSIPPPLLSPFSNKNTKMPQIICASATVGRTLRRQLMTILSTPSLDKTASLITSAQDVRTKKDEMKRKSGLLPPTLSHCFSFVNLEQGDDDGDAGDDDSKEETNVVVEEENVARVTMMKLNKQQRKEEEAKQLLIDTVSKVKHLMSSSSQTTQKKKNGPVLIFPGKYGVEQVQNELLLQDADSLDLEIKSLADISSTPPSTSTTTTTSNNKTTTQVYVIGDKFARGLDIPNIQSVYILSPPSSAAGYTHLAGRTGRNGMEGVAVTLLSKFSDVRKYVGVLEGLGLEVTEI
mmetsp:Transcript_35711/g.52320  ORF Transcript_35711/g.52320 Transcript_35711/m.52320 type:complete len:366 (-) Transcript_35711:174-1271(-)